VNDEGWHYSDGVQQAGPVPRATLATMLAQGIVQPTWLVWRNGLPTWVPASRIPELTPPKGYPPPPMQGISYRMPPAAPPPGADTATRMLIPIGRSPWAIAAGYMGLLSPLLIFAPLAIVLGIVAIVDMRKHPEKHGMGRAIFALVMGLGCIIGFAMMIFMR
jgi:hypothetical protein